MRIVHLLDRTNARDAAQQLRLIGPAVADSSTALAVCCFSSETVVATMLRDAGIEVHALNWTRWFDLAALWNLRAYLRDGKPDVIHVWSLPALRGLAFAGLAWLPKVLLNMTAPVPRQLAWHDRRLLERVRAIAVQSADEAERLRRTLVGPAIHVLPPAIAEGPTSSAAGDAGVILCCGPLERHAGVRFAIWAFDILRYLFSDWQLHLAGVGSDSAALRFLIDGLQNDAIRFLGEALDRSTLLQSSDLVLIPNLADGGREIALEAMAHGKAVIASNVPCLAELIRDGETGMLVPPGDVVALSRRAKMLIENADLRRRLGDAARQHVRQRFTLDAAVVAWRDVYRLAPQAA